MINLLPPEKKASYRYARYNTTLLKWLFGVIIGIAGIIIIVVGGLVSLNKTMASAKVSLDQSQQELQSQDFNNVKAQVSDISDNLNLMVTVLSKEILFSQLLQQIGSVMPYGTVLTDLNITQVQGGIDLQAGAFNYQDAAQIQVNLQDPSNKIFSKADIVSIQCKSTNNSSTLYPCTADIRAQFVTNNPFLFINFRSHGGSS